jgi:hypothetical protein
LPSPAALPSSPSPLTWPWGRRDSPHPPPASPVRAPRRRRVSQLRRPRPTASLGASRR